MQGVKDKLKNKLFLGGVFGVLASILAAAFLQPASFTYAITFKTPLLHASSMHESCWPAAQHVAAYFNGPETVIPSRILCTSHIDGVLHKTSASCECGANQVSGVCAGGHDASDPAAANTCPRRR